MKSWKTRLTILLCLQLILVLGVWASSYSSLQRDAAGIKILDFGPEEIDRVELSSNDSKAEIKKEEGKWILPGYASLGADQEKVTSYLTDLEALKSQDLVSDSSVNHQRFGVGEEDAQLRVKLYTGEKLRQDILLGKTPAFGKRYIRLAGEDAVHSTVFNPGQSAQDKDWLDKKILALPGISKLELPSFTLAKEGELWTVDGEEADLSKAKALAEKMENLSILEKAERPIQKADFKVKILTSDGTETSYQFKALNDKHYLQKEGDKVTFRVTESLYNSLAKTSLESFKTSEELKPISKKEPLSAKPKE